uniref:Rho-GAP domain-containing protein n=1 Tax=Caenorhabditis japonica TaxID=281687 RepID=A0A8R1I429_CAEJA
MLFNGRLRDSRDSSDFADSHDTLDVAGTSAHGGGVADSSTHHNHHHNYSMTAPVSPNVPLSASSSHSEGWKYSSQKLLWKLKPKYAYSHASSTSSSTDSAWKSLDSMTWRSVDGVEIVLRGARLENLSEIERSALQLLAAQRLAKMLPGVNLGKPKALRQKRQKLVKSNRTPTVADVQRRASGTPCPEEKRVFGVSLAMCMMNEKRLDQESRCRSLDDSTVCMLNKSKAKPTKSEPEIVGHTMPDDRKWLYPSTQNLYPSSSSNPTSPSPLAGSAPLTCSTLPSTNNLLSADSVEPQQVTGRFLKKQRPASASFSCSLDANIDDVDPHALQVPKIVENCTQYLMTYGLTQVGLFRVAGNTKRCRQLRNALEKVGGGAVINDNMVENTTAHDVATLLKEYFRDLPQSLLPAEHYSAYIGAAKFNIEERIEAIRLLFALLVSPNLDTLFVLLKFLHEVSCHSADRSNGADEIIVGNKMDARNLATIFAPSILRVDHDKLQETLAENELQVTIVETMISNVEEIFKIPKELQCKIYTKLRETEPDRLDRILNHLSKMDSHDSHPVALLSPFPATVEEDATSPRLHRHCDHSHIGRQSPLARELTTNGKVKVQSQRSGSWPFSLTRTQTSPNRPEQPQRFFPADSQDGQGQSSESAVTGVKSAFTTPVGDRKNDFNNRADDSGRDSEFCSDEIHFGTMSQPETARGRAESMNAPGQSSSSNKPPTMVSLQGTNNSKSVDARSPSRERVDIRSAARSSAAAARRRLRNVVRAFRFTSMARSTPDIVSS